MIALKAETEKAMNLVCRRPFCQKKLVKTSGNESCLEETFCQVLTARRKEGGRLTSYYDSCLEETFSQKLNELLRKTNVNTVRLERTQLN